MHNWKKCAAYVVTSVILLAALIGPFVPASAQVVYGSAKGYVVAIADEADLLTEEEERLLQQTMQPIAEYGNAVFLSVSSNASTTASLAESYYKAAWGRESGTIFVIDMDNRMIYIYSDGDIYRTITKSYANTITDNVYTYATNADYYSCASKAFEQIYTVLEGGRIAQPMKYISNVFLAVIISFILLYFWVKMVSKAKKPSESELLKGIEFVQMVDNFAEQFTHKTKTYSPQSSDSGGSSGGGSSGGGGGGGGGGGHSF